MSRAESHTEALEHDALCALDDADRKLANGGSFEELAAAFDNVGKKFAPLLESQGETWKAQELRRRVAESMLLSAITTDRPLGECEELLGRIIELGFTDLLRKAQVMSMFCGYWSRHGRTQQVLPYLIPLKAELEAEHARTGETVWANYLDDCQVIIGRLDDSRGRDDHDQ